MGTAAELASLLRDRGPAVFLTGAGISTESGIPDFRSAGGMWAEVDPYEVASIDAFRRDPLRVWRWYGARIRSLLEAEPNAGHVALAELEHAGHVRAIVTQNIDLLHRRAGSREVIEVHGSIARFPCVACAGEESLDDVLVQLETCEAPVCTRCGAIVKPGVVMFGELLPVLAMERAERLARDAGLLVVVGSSLQVWPVAGLPADTVRAGGAVAIVNLEETPYDAQAAVVVRAPSASALPAVVRELGADAADRVP